MKIASIKSERKKSVSEFPDKNFANFHSPGIHS